MAVAVPPFPIARFSVDQYHRMIASGAFTEHDNVELIDGWVVRKTAKGPGHEFTTGQLVALLPEGVGRDAHVRNQAPLTLEESEPEPDIAVVRGHRGDYRGRHPGGAEVLLVVEVSDTTLATDRLKTRTYASAGIPECWIVNLVDRCLEIYRQPVPAEGGYDAQEMVSAGQHIRVAVGAGAVDIAVDEVLP